MNLYLGNGCQTHTSSTMLRLSKHLACQSHACCFGASRVGPKAVRCCAQHLACRNRRHSLMVYCLLMLTCTQPSSLASLSARQSRATPSSGSSSCSAPIILRHQIIPCSAYSAEQSGHDCSQRGKPRICRVWSAHECAPARRLAVQPRPASSASALSE